MKYNERGLWQIRNGEVLVKIVKNILFPMRFTNYSLDILEYAVIFARSSRARLHLLHVMIPSEAKSFDELNEFFFTIMSDTEASVSRTVLDQVDLVKVHIKAEFVWQGIVDYAQDQAIDLIMMAVHQPGASSPASLGETTLRVLDESPCPVMVVRTPDERSKHQSRFELTLQEIKKEISVKKD
jgi:nucleotide-binding universal stress UspA family protein